MARHKSSENTRSDIDRSWAPRLADAVRRRRKGLGITQAELARLAGCGPVFVHAVERAKPSLRLDKLIALLEVLGLELLVQPGHSGLRGREEP